MSRLRLAPVALASSLLACNGTTSDGSFAEVGLDAYVDAPARVPAIHRDVALSCPTGRPAGSPLGGGTCATDADCAAGRNGRCNGGLTPNACTYDECTTDGDCGTAVCACRDSARVGAPNVCFRGDCRTDADCHGGYCSPSGVDIFWNCLGGVPIGSFGFFCHTPGDECVDKEDCGTGNASCVFDVDLRHYKCLSLACTK